MNETSSPDKREPLAARLVLWTIHGCVYLFAIALVSLVGALILGLFEHEIR